MLKHSVLNLIIEETRYALKPVDCILSLAPVLLFKLTEIKIKLTNTDIHDNIYGAVIVTKSHCESSPGLSECRTVLRGYRPSDQMNKLRL